MSFLKLIPSQAWYITAIIIAFLTYGEWRYHKGISDTKLEIAAMPAKVETLTIYLPSISGLAEVKKGKPAIIVRTLTVRDTLDKSLVDSLQSVISNLEASVDITLRSAEIGLLTVHYDPTGRTPATYEWQRPPEKRIIETKIILESRPFWELPLAVVIGAGVGYLGARAFR